MITIQKIIDCNRKALKDGTLGALHGLPVRYQNDDGVHGCAIGVCLSRSEISDIKALGFNMGSVKLIMGAGITFENFEIAAITQTIHDAWAGNRIYRRAPGLGRTKDEVVLAFEDQLVDNRVDRPVFEAWLDLLEDLYMEQNVLDPVPEAV